MNSFLVWGSYLDDKIKSKIINREYVELSTLLPRTEQPQALNMDLSQDSSQIAFTSNKVKPPANIGE